MPLLPLLASVLLFQGSALEKKISVSIPPTRLELLLPQLAAASGVQFWTIPATSQDVAMVSVKDVPLGDVLNRLAELSYAEWKPEPGGYRLVRSARQLRDAQAVDTGRRAALVAKALQDKLADLGKMPEFDHNLARQMADRYMGRVKQSQTGGGGTADSNFERMMGFAPIERAAPLILSAIGAADLGTLAPGRRLVYSTHPTRMQRALPAKAYPSLQALVRQQAMFAEAYDKVKPKDGSSYYFTTANPDISGNPELGPGESIVVLTPYASTINAQILIDDPKGQKLMSGNWSLSFAASDVKFAGEEKVSFPGASTELAKTLLEASNFGGRGKMMMTSVGADGPVVFESTAPLPPAAKLASSVKDRVLQPEKFEPLAWTAGAAIDALAKGKNIVAYLPDTAFSSLLAPIQSGESTDGVVRKALYSGGLELEEKDGWIVGRPLMPGQAIDQRTNRLALGALARRLDSQGYLRLLDLCDFAVAQKKRAAMYDIDGRYLIALNPGVATPAVQSLSMPATLRVYGTMSPAQRQTLAQGGKINVGLLTQIQRDWLTEEMFNWWYGSLVVQNAIRGKYAGESVSGERTRFMPNGVPPDAPFSIEIQESPALYAFNQGGEASILTPGLLANQKYQNERPDLNAGTAPIFERYRNAKMARYVFMIDLPGEVKYGHSADDLWVDKTGTVWTYESLPTDIREAADNALKRLRNTFGERGGAGNKGIPPQL